MRKTDFPPHLWLVFLATTLLAGLVGIVVDRHESLAAQAEIVRSHAALARIVSYRVESADYTEYGKPATVRIERDRYLLGLEFPGADGQIQHAELEWFWVHARGGMLLHRKPPWVGGLEALDRQPIVRIYQLKSAPAKVRLAYPLDELARRSVTDPMGEHFTPWFLLTFSLMIALISCLVYGVGYRLWLMLRE